jgi:hypothetical protein
MPALLSKCADYPQHLHALFSIRQHVAAVGRRVTTLCKGEEGLRQQLALYQTSYNLCLPHARLRQALPQPELTNGTGSAKQWRPCTPAMSAGLTDRVWTLREMWLYRVPPWPQPQALSPTWKHDERERERARCAYGRGQRLGGRLGNPIAEIRTVRLMSHEWFQTAPAGLSAGLRYRTM